VAGISGAGKSTVMAVLADSGYLCVDNLPVALLEHFLNLTKVGGDRFAKTALLLDIDSRESRADIVAFLQSFPVRPANLTLAFLDADNPTIIRRYSETRRPHPGFDTQKDRNLEDTIQRERSRLQPVKELANFVLDTTNFNSHRLRRELNEFLDSNNRSPSRKPRLNLLSFGFKFGIPLDCDLVADVRFLNNPHFVEHLRDHTGLESKVAEFVMADPDAAPFVQRYRELLEFLVPRYINEGKAYINVGIGCTGGKHRSVTIAEELIKTLNVSGVELSVKHRDLGR
jgi:RNase adapter protein RapZ